jgi:hypothetical protein
VTRACPVCSAPLGPAEDPRGCMTCRGVRLWDSQDRIVAMLDAAVGPLAHWDVKRLLESNGGQPVRKGSLMVWLATDPRTCWGGPGIYGLYRHGLLPRSAGHGIHRDHHDILVPCWRCLPRTE